MRGGQLVLVVSGIQTLGGVFIVFPHVEEMWELLWKFGSELREKSKEGK